MVCDIIKQAIPSAISAAGGARVQIVGKNTVPLQASVKEAQEGLYVLGDEQLVRGQFQGLFKSMAAGVARDGHSRQIGDFITVYAQPEGPVDLETGWNPAVNQFRIKARLLNEMEIDITDWAFRDVTPGREPFKLKTVSTGTVGGQVETGKAVHINGENLPAVADARVEWAVPEASKSGTVAATHLTGDCDRLDIAAAAFSELNAPAYDGKRLELKVRGNFANAMITATLKYVAVTPEITSVVQDTLTAGFVDFAEKKLTIGGRALKFAAGDTVAIEADFDGETVVNNITEAIVTNTDAELATGPTGFPNRSDHPDGDWAGKDATLVLTKGGVRYTRAVKFVA